MASQTEAPDAPDESDSPAPSGRPGTPIEPSRLFRALRRGRWILLLAAIIGVIAGALAAKFLVKRDYEAGASLRFEGVTPFEEGARADVRRDLPPQISTFSQPALLESIRNRMGLDAPLYVIQSRITLASDPETGLVSITTRAQDPVEAANFANIVIDEFLDNRRTWRAEQIRNFIGTLDGRIAEAQVERDQARARYDAFRRDHGVTDLNSEQEGALTQAANLRAEANMANTTVAALEARIAQLQEQVNQQPARVRISQGTTSSPEQTRLAALEAALREDLGHLSNDHPRVLRRRAEIEALRRDLAANGSTTVESFQSGSNPLFDSARSQLGEARAELRATRERATQLAALAEEAQARVSTFSAIEGEAAQLIADVNVKESVISALQNQRAHLSNMATNPDNGFRVITRAQAPEFPIASKTKYLIAAAIPAGLVVLVVLVLLLVEFRGLRLYSAAEIAYWANAPVVGTTTWPRDPRASSDLVADMDDFVPAARGGMLIVAATEHETPLAVDLAKQLSSDWLDSGLASPAGLSTFGDLSAGISRDTRPDLSARTGLLPATTTSAQSSHAAPSLHPHNAGQSVAHPGMSAAEFEAAPTQVQTPGGNPVELLGPPTIAMDSLPYGILRPQSIPSADGPRLIATAWEGPLHGQQLRRAARLADRVLVVVPSGATTVFQLRSIGTRLGHPSGLGYVVVGISEEFASLPDRAGDVESFWNSMKEA